MKKIVFLTALFAGTVLGLAKDNVEAKKSLNHRNDIRLESSYVRGFCEIRIYNGTTLVAYSFTVENTEADCTRKKNLMLFMAQYGGGN